MAASGPANEGGGSSRRPSRRFSSNRGDVFNRSATISSPLAGSPASRAGVPVSASQNFTVGSATGSTPGSVGGSALGSGAASPSASAHEVDIDNPDPRTVKRVARHLVPEEQGFNSLQLQSGDVTREIYNWQREHRTDEGQVKRGRSRSFDVPPEGDPDVGLARDMLVPGGFRREYIATHDTESIASGVSNYGATSHAPAAGASSSGPSSGPIGGAVPGGMPAGYVFTRNFIEFLSLYGHFAGEELEEDEDGEDESVSEDGVSESARLVRPSPRPPRRHEQAKGQASTTETIMLLLKSFVGTGVLFLPRAFFNGGLLFSSLVLVFVSIVSYWCFLLLIATKEHTRMSSFGDIGGALYGEPTRKVILGSIVLSQIGFAAAYIVFVAENLGSFVQNVRAAVAAGGDEAGAALSISTLIVLQLAVFLPLSMVRDIAKLGFTALIADAFILLGLLYLYSWSGFTLMTHGMADVAMFNSASWTLFIGTAVFTYEGIGLIIPIQESMRNPRRFGPVLGGVMVAITVIFVSVGALLYAATGSSVETVILLNLPRGQLTNTVQLLYSVAILLSTPLQLFPAIRILENALFVRSGKFSRKVKWQKNVFRFVLVFFTGIVAYCGADDLDKFVALIGSLACVPLVYIYPPLLHLRIVAPQSIGFYADIALAVFGAGIMAYTSFMTALSWISA